MKQYNPQLLIPFVEKMIKDGQLHRTLYTYMPIDLLDERVKPVFEECKLWFSSPANFNDPFDCRIYPHIPTDDELAKYLATHAENASPDDYNIIREGIQKFGSGLAKQAIDDVMNKSGVKCFTPNNANILMWSHYTNSHKGICLEFDTLIDPEFFVYPINVVYSKKYPNLEFTDKRFTTEVLRTKSKDWEYEQEVRVYKTGNGYYFFNPQSLRSITFGCNTPVDKQSQIIEIIRRNKYLDHVHFFKCKTSSKEFKLEIDALIEKE